MVLFGQENPQVNKGMWQQILFLHRMFFPVAANYFSIPTSKFICLQSVMPYMWAYMPSTVCIDTVQSVHRLSRTKERANLSLSLSLWAVTSSSLAHKQPSDSLGFQVFGFKLSTALGIWVSICRLQIKGHNKCPD